MDVKSIEKFAEKPAYVLVRFDSSNIQTFRNSVTKSQSILTNYGGSVVCGAPLVCVREGAWPKSKTIGILAFGTLTNARRWLTSDPEPKQPDWLAGADIVIIPVKYFAPLDKTAFFLFDVKIADNERFCTEYIPGHMPDLEKSGASAAVVASSCYEKVRGLWQPDLIVMHQWEDLDSAEKWYSSDSYQKFKKLRESVADSTLIIFEHEPWR